MENINIVDNFFSEKELNNIISHIKEYKWRSLCLTDIINQDLGIDYPFWKIDLSDNKFFSEYLLNVINRQLDNKYIVTNVYAVGQTYEQVSNYHTDAPIRIKKDTYYTFCYYINENIDNDGYLYIKLPNKKHIICIEPIMNRGILFLSNYIHKGSAYNNTDIRVCVVWKLILEND